MRADTVSLVLSKEAYECLWKCVQVGAGREQYANLHSHTKVSLTYC